MAVKEQDLRNSTDELQQALNEQLANWAVAYVKLHQFHWFVKGPHFATLHAKFEELYDMAASKLDELAERMLAIGLQPASSMKAYLGLATIRESELAPDGDQEMLASVAADFGTVVDGLKRAVKLAESRDDEATVDMLIAQIEELQKQMWMLNAMQGK